MSSPFNVKILDREFTVGVEPGEQESLQASARFLDARMREIRGNNRMVAIDQLAVLAALNLAFDIADREAADLAAERAQPAGHTHTIGSTSQPSDASTDDQQLQALVRRLDDALGEDGRLL